MDRALITGDDEWMLPIYGADDPGGDTYAAVAFSPDIGRTWTNKTVVARSSKVTFYEPAITRMSDGRFMAVIRTQNPPFDSYLSLFRRRGPDVDGTASPAVPWTDPVPLPTPLRRHSLLLPRSRPATTRRERKRDCRRRQRVDVCCAGLPWHGLELRIPICRTAPRRPPLLRLLLLL